MILRNPFSSFCMISSARTSVDIRIIPSTRRYIPLTCTAVRKRERGEEERGEEERGEEERGERREERESTSFWLWLSGFPI